MVSNGGAARGLSLLATVLLLPAMLTGAASSARRDGVALAVAAGDARAGGISLGLVDRARSVGGSPITEISLAGDSGRDALVVPLATTAGARQSVWLVHAVGLVAEIIGVFMSFWLARAAGMVPAPLSGRIFALSLLLGLASYSSANATSSLAPVLTPQHVFASVKDGFVWAAAFPIFARAFGMTRDDAEGQATS